MLAQRAAEQAAQRRRERMIRGAAVAVVFVVLEVVLFMATRAGDEAPDDAALQLSTAGGGVPVGTAEAPVLELYEDFEVPDLQDIRGRVGQHVGRPGLGRHRAHRVLPAVVPRPAAWQ